MSSVGLRSTGWMLFWAVAVSAALHLGGLQKNLPYAPESDETMRVSNSLYMVVSGTLNPRWFGHPGITTFYPLAGLYYTWGVTACGANPARPGPALQARFDKNRWEFFMLGRLVSAAYSVLTLPILFLLGRRVFGERAAVAAAWLMAFYQLIIYYGATIRTDTAATFFGMLSLWLCLRLLDAPNRLNHLLAGMAIGFAVASRYFMIALVPVLLFVDILVFRRTPRGAARAELAYSSLLGMLAVAATFVILNPYLFLEASTAARHIRNETRVVHLGADGLSRSGNFVWYLVHAIPNMMSWPQAVLAGAGFLMVLARPRADRLVLVGYALAFLVAISLLALHWQRWIIQVVPILALLAAFALDQLVGWAGNRLRWNPARQGALLAVAVAVLSAWPGFQAVRMTIRFSRPSTQVVAREWILANIPRGSRIGQDFYGPQIDGLGYQVFEQFSLSQNRTLEDYRREGFEYLITCSQIDDRYFRERDRYPQAVAFYESLARNENLLQEFAPSAIRGGPTIRIFRLKRP